MQVSNPPTDYHANSVLLHDATHRQWLLFRRTVRVVVADTLDSVVAALRTIEKAVRDEGLHAAGFLAYEAAPAFDPVLTVRPPGRFPLLWFGLYGDPEPFEFSSAGVDRTEPLSWQPNVSVDEYRAAIERIKTYIRAGDTYQVNYSLRMRAPYPDHPWRLFTQMIHAQGDGYGAFIDTPDWALCSASPELFFQLRGNELICRPMKGTAARGPYQASDLKQADWLRRSMKNRAENVMIVDMARNDLGRIAKTGSVQVTSLLDVERYPTLWQMTSTVRGETQASVTNILQALFPAASITGAPKARTMQIIAELETTPRRIYTGTIGFLAPNRWAQFNVAIRTVLVDKLNRTAEYGVGGGIVWDSEIDAEWRECQTKAAILTRPAPDFALLETLRWTPDAGYFLLEKHLERLASAADYFSRSIDMSVIRGKLTALECELPPQPHRVRLRVPRHGDPSVEASLPKPYPQPYRVRLAAQPLDSQNPFLYYKTTHRRVYEQALAAWPDYDDVLLWNERAEITESCIANVVVELQGRLVTPPVQSGLLAGTYRDYLLEQGKISEGIIRLQNLRDCSRIYLINSVRGLWEVTLENDTEGH